MKRSELTTAVVAGIGGNIGLQMIEPDLYDESTIIYPYYTIETGPSRNDSTFFPFSHKPSRKKTVKVRFVEGRSK